MRACACQATDDELRLAHSADHIAYVDGPPGPDDWVMGDNFFSEATPVAARTAAGCTVQARAPGRRGMLARAGRQPAASLTYTRHCPVVCSGECSKANLNAMFRRERKVALLPRQGAYPGPGRGAQAVEAVLAGAVASAFAVIRPPGHHAECARAMGFCFYNNVAVAALAARRAGARPLVLDWDVHHGNGIQDILWEEDIAYVSLHRRARNPGSTRGEEAGQLAWLCLGPPSRAAPARNPPCMPRPRKPDHATHALQ